MGPGSAAVSLARLVELLPTSAALLTAGSDAVVGSVQLHDPLTSPVGALVLGINLQGSAELVRELAAAGATGFVLRDAQGLAATCEAVGLGLLELAEGLSWEAFRGQVEQALGGDDEDAEPIKDLFALADAIAAMMGAAVAIEDPQSQLLAYSGLNHPIDEARQQTILARRNPEAWAARLDEVGVLQQLMAASEGVLRIEDPQGKARNRVASVVRAGGELLGSIWVVEGDTPLGVGAESQLLDATPLAALHLLRHRAHSDSSRRREGRQLRRVLDGQGGALPFEADTTSVVAFALRDASELELPRTRDLVIDLITVACEAYRRKVVCAWVDTTVYAVISGDGVTGLVNEVCRRASAALGVTVRAGLGTTAAGVDGVPRSRGEADRAVRVLVEGRRSELLVTFEDVRVPSTLLELRDHLASRSDLRLPVLLRIAEEDGETDYLATLRAYVAARGDLSVVAEQLHLHRNTVRYRLRRLQEVYGLDLLDPDHYLLLSLELLLR